MTRDVSADNSFPFDGAVPSVSEKRAVTAPSNVLTIIGTITSQVVLITGLFYYFGWIYTHSFYDYFGVDTSLLGYGTTDYILRSSNVAFHPFIYLTFAALALFSFHHLVVAPALSEPVSSQRSARPGLGRAERWARAFRRWRLGPSSARWSIGLLHAVAIVLVAVVFAGMMLPEQLGAPLGFFLPLLLMLSVSLLGYVAHVRSTYPDVFEITMSSWSTSPSRAYTLILLVLGLVAGLWAVSLYGVRVGNGFATDMAAELPGRPGVVIYSTERIALNGPGVTVAEISQPGSKYHFQYTGIRLLVRAPDKFLLLPARWQHGRDRVFLLRDDTSIRIDIVAR